MFKNIINISKAASIKLNKIAKNNNTKSLYLSVKGGGCNGFNYQLEPYYKDHDKLDEIVKCDDINIIICNKSLMYLLGTTIDWKKNIMGESFYFENPNAITKCGCGTSFSTKY